MYPIHFKPTHDLLRLRQNSADFARASFECAVAKIATAATCAAILIFVGSL